MMRRESMVQNILCGVLLTVMTVAATVVPAATPDTAALRHAIVDLKTQWGGRYPRGQEFLSRLDTLEKQPRLPRPAFERLKSEALLANPLLTAQPILFVVRAQYRSDHHNTETMFQTGEINTNSFAGGGALKVLDLKTSQVRTLLETREGLIRDPEVSFDGTRIVFALRKNITEDYKIHEIGADGTGHRQLTTMPGVFDIDPFYLPDGSIAFTSSREPKYCMCNVHIMGNLYRMEGDGANIHQIGKDTLFEGHGSLLPDGRLLYDRWEYVDRNFGDAQGLWTANPDGTNHAVFWGNNTPSPGAVIDARAIPGTPLVIAVLGSCHDRPWGALGVIDRRLGLDGRAPIVHTWPAAAADLATTRGEILFDSYKKVNPKYEDPYPLGDAARGGAGKYFLCSRLTGKGKAEEMGLYLVDIFGNEVLLHAEAPGCYDPMPLAPHPRPPVVAGRRDFATTEGTFYIQDVYEGTQMRGVRRGEVKSVRVVEEPEKRHWTIPAWGGQGVERPAMNWHDFNNKRILGTAPVEADGSAYFTVPAGRFLYFQLLDANGMMVQSMRSGTLAQPGEVASCVGCHEERRATPGAPTGRTTQALRRAPSRLAPWHGPERAFNYLAEVQPVFNRHCLGCHDTGKRAALKLNLAPDRDLVFNTSYIELWRKKLTGAIGAGPPQIQEPRAWGSAASPLIKKLRAGHHGVKLDPDSFDRLVTWIDLNAPYYPDYATAWPRGLGGRAPLETKELARLEKVLSIDLSKWASYNGNTGPLVSFERPELSPCLAPLRGAADGKYAEVLSIIQAGARALKANPNPDAPGFTPCETDRRREEKYQRLLAAELRSREAILKGKKVYDPVPDGITKETARK